VATHFKFLTVRQLKRNELRRYAKFGGNRSNRCRDRVIFDFPRWRLPPSWISKILNFQQSTASRSRIVLPCQIWSKSAEPLSIYRMAIFQDGVRSPSWICCVDDWTTHEGRLVVFITVQNLVGSDAVVLIICKF